MGAVLQLKQEAQRPHCSPELYWLISRIHTTEETLVVEMRIWCIKIGIVFVLHFNPWVEASAGGL
jgi:hypothetical protein